MPQIPLLLARVREQAYPNGHVSGYSIGMSADLNESILSPSVLLWLGSVLIAAILMLSLMNRRRTKLTDSLREFVDKTNPTAGDSPSADDDA